MVSLELSWCPFVSTHTTEVEHRVDEKRRAESELLIDQIANEKVGIKYSKHRVLVDQVLGNN